MKDILNNLFIPTQVAVATDQYGTVNRGYIDEFGKPRCLGAKNVKEYDTVKNAPIRNTLVGKIDMRSIGTASVPYNSIAISGTTDSIQNCKCYIKLTNFFAILPHLTVVNGVIQEELVEGFHQGEAYYIPKDSNFYKNSIEYTASRFAAVDSEKPVKVNKFSNSNLIPGHVYRKRNGESEIFVGKHKIFIVEIQKIDVDEFNKNRAQLSQDGWVAFPYEVTRGYQIKIFRYVLKNVCVYWPIRSYDKEWPAKDELATRTGFYFTSARSYCEDLGEHLTSEEITELMSVARLNVGYDWGNDGMAWKNPITNFRVEDMTPEDAIRIRKKLTVTDSDFPCDYTIHLYTEPERYFGEFNKKTFTFMSNAEMIKFFDNPNEYVMVLDNRYHKWENTNFTELIKKFNLKKCDAYRKDGSYAYTWFNWNASHEKN